MTEASAETAPAAPSEAPREISAPVSAAGREPAQSFTGNSETVKTAEPAKAPAAAEGSEAEKAVEPATAAGNAGDTAPEVSVKPAGPAQPAKDEALAAQSGDSASLPASDRGAAPSSEEGASSPDSAAESAPAAETAPAPRRRGRKPKAVADAEAAPAAAGEGDADAPAAPKRRRGRPRKADRAARDKAVAEAQISTVSSEAEPVSGEVAAARALSKVSQAEVARKQRAEEDRVAAAIAAGTSPDGMPPMPTVPLIDPSLRPHRRGRKPKAYVEAEKAAAAALAAQQAEYLKKLEEKKAEAAGAGDGSAKPAGAQGDQAVSGEGAGDVRPGRARRSKDAEQQPEPRDGTRPAEDGQTGDAAEGHRQQAGHQRHRQRQQDDRSGDQQNQRGNGRDGGPRSGRQNNRDRKGRGNNRFNAPAEPSVSREELAALKVAELRDRARGFGIDYVGRKKAELVDEVYAASARAEGFREAEGILDVTPEGFGYVRAHGYMPSRDDAFVAAGMIRAAGLRPGDLVAGTLRPMRANDKYPGLARLSSVNGRAPEEARGRPKFGDLTPVYPDEPLRMEHGRDSITGRAIDIVAPVGKGQRGLIVSPPKAGKTTVLKRICESIAANNPEVYLICLLVDERPEEVTDMQRSIKGDVVASTFDMPAENHTVVSELVIERAKRLVEMGRDVVVVLDSITRLARAYNLAQPASGRILSGGVDSAALYPPKRFLGAARNIENGGSLTILASALVDTGSKMDEVIFEEFKGTGNMELKLDRDLADKRIFPAIDPVASGTRNEELLIDPELQPFVWGIRRILANMNNTERAEASLIKGLRGTNDNQEFLIRSAKKAQQSEYADAL